MKKKIVCQYCRKHLPGRMYVFTTRRGKGKLYVTCKRHIGRPR